MISKKAKELLESLSFGLWNNSWWEGPEYQGEVVDYDGATMIVEEAEDEVIELMKNKILEAIPDPSIEKLINEIIGELKNEK